MKINSKWINDLIVRPENLKLVEEIIGKKLQDIHIDKEFLNRSPITQKNESNWINELNSFQKKNKCSINT
jgi:hypothetical protein